MKKMMMGLLCLTSTGVFAQQNETEELEKVVTVASKREQSMVREGKNVVVISQEDLLNKKGLSLTDVLNSQGGFYITNNYSNASEPKTTKVRGGGNKNVVILLDGMTQKDASGVDNTMYDLRNIDLNNVESIEIINGASSVLYGSNAATTVIDIKLKKSYQKKINGYIGMQGGSYETYQQNAGVYGGAKGFTYQLDANNEKSKGLSSALDEKNKGFDKDGYEKQNINTNLGYKYASGSIVAQVGWDHFLSASDAFAFADGKNKTDSKNARFGLVFNQKHKNGDFRLSGKYNTGIRDNFSLGAKTYEIGQVYKNSVLFAEALENYQFNKYLNVTAGAQIEKSDFNYSGLLYDANYKSYFQEDIVDKSEAKIQTVDGFLNTQFNIANFYLQAGTRISNHEKYGNNWVYSINPYYIFGLNKAKLKVGASVASAFIAPSLYQLYGDNGLYITPNLNLNPEKNTNYETNLAFYNGKNTFEATASFFYRDEKESIGYVPTPNTYKGQYMNGGKSNAKGVEVGFTWKMIKKLQLQANYSFVQRDTDASMFRLPKTKINASLTAQPWAKTSFGLNYQFTGARNDSFYNSTTYSSENVVLSQFQLIDFFAKQNIGKQFYLFGRINNVFNTPFIDVVGYTTKDRNYTVGARFDF